MTVSDEERQLTAVMIQALADQLAPFMPELAADTETFTAFCIELMQQQADLQPVLQDALDPATQEKYPFWGFNATDKNGGVMTVCAPKSPFKASEDPSDFFAYIVILSVVSFPIARALFNVVELRLDFFQRADRPESRIIH